MIKSNNNIKKNEKEEKKTLSCCSGVEMMSENKSFKSKKSVHHKKTIYINVYFILFYFICGFPFFTPNRSEETIWVCVINYVLYWFYNFDNFYHLNQIQFNHYPKKLQSQNLNWTLKLNRWNLF